MTDRILLGKNKAGNEGVWVSKPGVDVVAIAGNTYLQSFRDWYGYQEEFDGDGLGEDKFYEHIGWNLANTHMLNGFGGHLASFKKTPEGTLLYKLEGSDTVIYSKGLTVDDFLWTQPGLDSFIGLHYPIVEMRLRRLHTSTPAPIGAVGDFRLWFYAEAIGNTSAYMVPGNQPEQPGSEISAHPTEYPSGSTYKAAFPDSEVLSEGDKSPWRTLEWDMSENASWIDPYAHKVALGQGPANYSSEYRITGLRWDLNDNAVLPSPHIFPMADPLWEIDYVRVKKKDIPPNAGRYGSADGALIFDSDKHHVGLVHQTGIVTIGTSKAYIDGNTSNRVAGHNIDNDANGYVSFPALDYIPLVLFERINENDNISYGGGEDEYSICIQNWEDHRYPTIDLGHFDDSDRKGYDIQTVDHPINTDSYLSFHVTNCTGFYAHFTGFNDFEGPYRGAFGPTFASNGPVYWSHHNNFITTTWGPVHSLTAGPSRVDSASIPSAGNHDPRSGNFPGPHRLGEYMIPIGFTNYNPFWIWEFMDFYPNFYPGEWDNVGAGPANMIADTNIGNYMFHSGSGAPSGISTWNSWVHGNPSRKWKPGRWSVDGLHEEQVTQFPSNHSLPWTGPIPGESRRAGEHFSDMIESFSEIRTFAYARAKKDGFWLTCRNAIAQEGMEPALNLAPVLPENATANQGWQAFTDMSSNNDNGAWGMFHPALALYDGKKFTEGLQLKWDTRTSANSVLLNKVGTRTRAVGGGNQPGGAITDTVGDGQTFGQYKWRPEFSCSGLPFNGALALPNDPAPTDMETFPLAYEMAAATAEGGHGGINDPTGPIPITPGQLSTIDVFPNMMYTANGLLRGDTGGFYPYRYQKNEHWHGEMEGADRAVNTLSGKREEKWWYGFQYNIRRLSSEGIFHPQGVVPDNEEAFNNKNVSITGTEIKNQTAYIGGSVNTKSGSAPGASTSYDPTKTNPPKYRYWVLRVPMSIPEYT